LADMRHFQIMNEEFAKVFAKEPPARTTVEARLAEPEMLVEIEAIAWVG
jgi:2-iminobutanoate/2-iminopropanoate deaminase